MLRLTECGCGLRSLVRIHRTPWMKLFPGRRFYRCEQCGARQFMRPPATLKRHETGFEPTVREPDSQLDGAPAFAGRR